MQLANLPVDISYGKNDAEPKPEPMSAHDEEEDSEEATPEQKAFVKSTLGFDPAELFAV